MLTFSTSTLNVALAIDDANDNRPRFLQNVYNTTVSEQVVVGSPVIHVSAKDNDVSKANSEVYYRLYKPVEGSRFEINNSTG